MKRRSISHSCAGRLATSGAVTVLMALVLPLLCVSARQAAEVATSVTIYSLRDMEEDIGGGKTLCETLVTNSLGFNQQKINFVLAVWSFASKDRGVWRYGYYNGFDETKVFAEPGASARFQAGLSRCFKAAVDAGFGWIHVTPHLNPYSLQYQQSWRNVINFDPLLKTGPPGAEYSYSDVLLEPAARALNAAVKPSTIVEFTLSAEQGLTVFKFPWSWVDLVERIRSISCSGLDCQKHRMGVSFNYDKVCGCVEPEEPDPITYNTTYLERFGRFKASWGLSYVHVDGVKALIDAVDFIGCSGYASLPLDLDMTAMERSIQTVAFELAAFKIDLLDYLWNKNKTFVYTEHGLGGIRGKQVAPDLQYVAARPFEGLNPTPRTYNASLDPWLNPDFTQYRRKLYKLLSAWAAAGGGPQYKVDAVFVWNLGTFDVHGIHPWSTSNDGTYGDPIIQEVLRRNNAAARAAWPGTVPVEVSLNNTADLCC